MKYKHVMAAHELRMWILTVTSGAALVNAVLTKHPEVKETICKPFDTIKQKLTKETDKKEEVIRIVIVKND